MWRLTQPILSNNMWALVDITWVIKEFIKVKHQISLSGVQENSLPLIAILQLCTQVFVSTHFIFLL